MVRLIPSDQNFFPMLTELAVRLTSAASLLTDLFEHPAQRDPLVGLIRQDEHTADALTQMISRRLRTSFVPPLDATEIYELASAIDGTIDLVEDAASRVQTFRMDEVDTRTRQLGAIMLRCAGALETAVRKLPDAGSVLDGIGDVWRLEEEADGIYTRAIEDLFTGEQDPLEVLKRKELYDVVEESIDLSKDVAELLTSIAIKRS